MIPPNSKAADGDETHGRGETDRPGRLRRALSTVSKRDRNGTIAALIGGVLIARAVRTARRNRRRAGALALGGGVLLGGGLRRRDSRDRIATAGGDGATGRDGTEAPGTDDGSGTGSDEARAHRERADVQHQDETNPRGVSGEPDVETETDPDEGSVRFTTDQEVEESEPKPHLDGHATDPRLHDEDDPDTTDDHVEVDLSESAMADEASEAAGPTDEQSYPAREGTDPEPLSDGAPPRYGEGAVANEGPDDEDLPAGEDDRTDGDVSERNDEERT